MSIFNFDDNAVLGEIVRVETTRVWVRVESAERLREARVGRLVAVMGRDGNEWVVGMIERMWRNPLVDPVTPLPDGLGEGEYEEIDLELAAPAEDNGLQFVMLGTYRAKRDGEVDAFTRAVLTLPAIDESVYPVEKKHLEDFMKTISRQAQEDHESALEIGKFALDPDARAFIDANKLLQRHAALVGTTGSGKSWTVAALMEQIATLPHCNAILFDLHGEYSSLTYATKLRVAGPADLGTSTENLMYLPYWLLTYDEIEAMFVDRSAFTAHNQAAVLRDTIEDGKRNALSEDGHTEVLESFTVDSPVPYDLDAVVAEIERRNEEMVEGSRGPKQGPFHGAFTRFLVRLRSKIQDRRYGFMYQLPGDWNEYETLHRLTEMLLGHGGQTADGQRRGLKIVDFSEVPADVLPVMVSLVARLIFQTQFWSACGTVSDQRHPLLMVCDEAHLYLPSRDEAIGPLERRALENFERIAKEGRKYGVGLLIVSQRPADVSTTILSQCNNFMALRLTNSLDQGVVRRLMPESLGALLEVLPALDVGEAVVVGDATLLPTRVKLRPPTIEPLSKTIDFWTEWSKEEVDTDLKTAVENLRRQCRLPEEPT